jgi:peptidoglycan/xylan/chitin deacetylase (PgdA/CDA1 family)
VREGINKAGCRTGQRAAHENVVAHTKWVKVQNIRCLIVGAFWVFLLGSLLVVSRAALAQTDVKAIALTFDDLPVSTIGQDPQPEFREQAAAITQTILGVLKKHNALAAGFVNEMKLNTPGARDFYCGLLMDWLAAGHLLGNHGYSHLEFGQVTIQQYEDDFLRGDVITPLLLDYRGTTARYYRYPYNDTGDTARKKQEFLQFLAAHGYKPAPMTFENDDWMYTELYEDALTRNDKVEKGKLKNAYFKESERKIAFIESTSAKNFHRQIAQIADLHVNQMTADVLDELLTLFERHGYKFISMEQALADPAYETKDDFVGSDGISWLLRWQPALGLPIGYRDEPDPPQWVQDEYHKLLNSQKSK